MKPFLTEVPLVRPKSLTKGDGDHFLIEEKYFYQKTNIFYTRNSTIPTHPTRITLSNYLDWPFLPFSNQRCLFPLVLIDTHSGHLSFHLFWIGNDTSFHSFGLIIPFSWQSPQEPLSIYLDLFSLNNFNVTSANYAPCTFQNSKSFLVLLHFYFLPSLLRVPT